MASPATIKTGKNNTGGMPSLSARPTAEMPKKARSEKNEPQARLTIFCTPNTSCSPAATRNSTAAWNVPPRTTSTSSVMPQTGIFPFLIQSQKSTPGGFCNCSALKVSIDASVGKSYLLLLVDGP